MVNVIFILTVWLVYWVVQTLKPRKPYMDIWKELEGEETWHFQKKKQG